MLLNVSSIRKCDLMASDGVIGKCKDFLFDDGQWTIRYMVADTARWLPGRKVLISPLSLGSPLWPDQLPVNLTKEQIKESPPLDEDAPVSREYEIRWADHYQYPYYWPHGDLWGIRHYGPAVPSAHASERIEDAQGTNLRSAKEVTGYHIEARDGGIGHVEDFIVDDTMWSIRYLVIDTRNWLPGRKVLVAAPWVDHIRWADETVHVTMDKEQIENSPPYDPKQPVNLGYEARLYDYYGRPVARL
ncbi:MAG: PRC-barrel domain-containing protein [Desulfobacterales bacterium]|jgi:hypothetical protein